MATIGIKVDTNFAAASAEIKKFATVTTTETKKMTQQLKKLENFQADKFIQKNKRIAASVRATKGATAALATEHRGLERKIQMLIRNGVDPMDRKLEKLRKEYKRTGKEMQKAKKRTVSWGAGLRTAAFAAAGAFVVIKKLVSSASNLAEQTTKFDKVFSDSTFNIAASVDVLRDSYAMSTREAKQNLGSIQDLLKPMGVMPNLAAKMSTEIVKLSADLGSFNNVPTADVMRAMSAAMVGSYMPMRRFGVVMNETTILQEAMRLGLVNNKKEMTASTKAQAAFSLIQKGSADATGDMIRTADSYANSLKFMKARAEDMTAQIGQAFIPAAKFFIGIITNIMKAFQKLSPGIRTFIIILGVLVVAILLVTKVVVGFGVAFSAAIWPVTLIIAAIAAVIAITVLMVKKWVAVKKVLLGIWKIIKAGFEAAFYPLKLIIVTIVNSIVASLAFVAGKVVSIVSTMIDIANLAIKFIPGVAPISTKGLDNFETNMNNVAKQSVANIAITAGSIKRIAQDSVDGAKQVAAGTVELFKSSDKKVKKVVKGTKGSLKVIGTAAKKQFKVASKSAETEFQKVENAFDKMITTLLTENGKKINVLSAQDALMWSASISKGQNKNILLKEIRQIDLDNLMENLGAKQTAKILSLANDLTIQKQHASAVLLLNAAARKSDEIADKKRNKAKLVGTKQFLSDMMAVTQAGGKKTFAIFKAMSIANATISGIEAAVTAWKAGMSIGGPAAPVFAAAFTAASLAKTGVMIAGIASQKSPSAETGGDFVVPNNRASSRVDSQSMNVNPGETVSVSPRGEESGKSQTINVMLDNKVLWSSMQQAFDNGRVTISNENIASV